ncbi:MAG TPA: hypothetical protein VGN91_00350 [Bosea sp. (in: a-proteobacteria)]|jgi:hypothetical protein|nr:hypothetical protein [Bosea sp. (in: a-proteobacteria)]
MAKRSVISDVDLLKGAEAIAADMQGPEGQRLKLARVIDAHLDWFEQARRRGLEWNDIVALLFRAGATRSDGRPLSRGHLQSLVWRKQQAQHSVGEKTVAREELPSSPVKRTARSPAEGGQTTPRGSKRLSAKRAEDPARSLPEQHDRSAASDGKPGAQPEGNALLAYMKRAARLRREE